MGQPIKDIAGKRFGSLVAIEPVIKVTPEGKNRVHWKFQCDCGNTVVRIGSHLARNKINHCPECNKGTTSHAWKGVGDLPKDVFNTIYHGAISRNLTFEVTIEQLWDLFVEQKAKCALTGWDLQFNKTYRGKTQKTASLDRIDSTKGYSIDNVQWVHRDVNKLKKNLPDQYFIDLCVSVANYRKNTS